MAARKPEIERMIDDALIADVDTFWTEYARGVAQAKNWQEERRLFGDEAADAMEMERELRFGDDY